jgi:hypothetical protein
LKEFVRFIYEFISDNAGEPHGGEFVERARPTVQEMINCLRVLSASRSNSWFASPGIGELNASTAALGYMLG